MSRLSGTLPAAWGSPGAFPSLLELVIGDGNIVGNLPEEWSGPGFPLLQLLSIENVGLTGTLPPQWLAAPEAFPNLRRLTLGDCGLSGTLPASWGDEGHLSRLQVLDLRLNNLSGPVPDSWLCGGLPALTALWLPGNRLSSLPPCCLPPTSQLLMLYLGDNQLQGSLPFSEEHCSSGNHLRVQILSLSGNQLTGTLPAVWPAIFPELEELILGRNQLTGDALPDAWAALAAFPHISSMSFTGNNFSWGFPSALLEKPSMQSLDMGECGIQGPLPPRLAPPRNSPLASLDFSSNQLTGALPPDWPNSTAFQRLLSLNLSFNLLEGTLPPTWIGSSWQPHIAVQGNNLSGPLPLPMTGGETFDTPYVEVLPGNEALCLPESAKAEPNSALTFFCHPEFTGDISEVSACTESLRECGWKSDSAGSTSRALPAAVSLLAAFNFLLLALAVLRRWVPRHKSVATGSGGEVQLAGFSTGVSASTSSGPGGEAEEELEALLRDSSSSGGGVSGGHRSNESHAGAAVHAVPAAGHASTSPAWELPIQTEPAVAAASAGSGLQALLLRHEQDGVQCQQEQQHMGLGMPDGSVALNSGLGRVRMEQLRFCRTTGRTLSLLGKGASGTVFKAELAGSGAVAVKVLRKQSVDEARLWREAEIMHSCRHPSILQLVGVCEAGGLVMLVSELVERGSLDKLLHLPDTRWHARGREMLLEVAQAVQHLHSRNILHADIKPQNVLVTYHWHAKLADVGTARYLKGGIASSACGGTILYAAPEQLLGLPCTAAADIFSLGLLMLAVVVGQAGQVRGLCRSPKVPEECPPEVAELISACLDESPTARPSAEAVLQVLLNTGQT
ncbi:hypothetical protein N2152v2_008594 [Parachlorella kessleri]